MLEPAEPVEEAPPEAPPLCEGVLLGDELPEAPPVLGGVLEDELLPFDGVVVEPVPPAGLVAVLPEEVGELLVAVEPLLGGLLEPLLFEPELSQATSEAAESKAAAISHLWFIG